MQYAKYYLEEIEKYDRLMQNKIAEIKQLRCLATSVTAVLKPDKVQTSGAGDKVGHIVSLIVDTEAELQTIINHFFSEKTERIKLIEQLENPLEYTVLHKKYIQYKRFDDIAAEENYTLQYIYEVHAKALKKIDDMLKNLTKPKES